MAATQAVASAPAPEYTLTAMDRCDQCGAQAYFSVSVAHSEGKVTDMLFCAHHFRKGEEKLRKVAISIIDESERLLAYL